MNDFQSNIEQLVLIFSPTNNRYNMNYIYINIIQDKSNQMILNKSTSPNYGHSISVQISYQLNKEAE